MIGFILRAIYYYEEKVIPTKLSEWIPRAYYKIMSNQIIKLAVKNYQF